MDLTYSPKQNRSQQTEDRLLNALESLLEEMFFDQVSIKQLAARAGVAVGTVYRRFKDKEALLPVLYQRFDLQLQGWVDSVWSEETLAAMPALEERLTHLLACHVEFYLAHRGMMRTVHLYSRLKGDLDEPGRSSTRRAQYEVLLEPVFALRAKPLTVEQQRVFILVLVSSLTEALLYNDVNPGKALALEPPALVRELSAVLAGYLE